ncbi:hypothetical protein M408DRAFT_333183 [Serendipita vermifera MAFF 305830]|uniref:Uncharacterized protein n=1 Tax=Serendipita vermifera MAFF 305830 TaxID=933852 RepID=A0A0C3APC6_SERVB|nr:hypothetical protein M408DRAFT_333183 [Serendipita vermifera MAFF 305830]
MMIASTRLDSALHKCTKRLEPCRSLGLEGILNKEAAEPCHHRGDGFPIHFWKHNIT